MTVADDLATLRVLTTGHWTTRAALDRVEAEIARLDEILTQAQDECTTLREEIARLREYLRKAYQSLERTNESYIEAESKLLDALQAESEANAKIALLEAIGHSASSPLTQRAVEEIRNDMKNLEDD